MAVNLKFTKLLREINLGTRKVIFIPPQAGSTLVHSEKLDFLFRNIYLQEYQRLTELPQNGLKILVSDVPVSFRALSPLLPHVNLAQRAIIIAALDPPIQAMFQKAYMLKPYEPGKSKEILQGIIESRLEILPSFGKAKRVLEGEGSAVIGNR